MLQFAPAAQQLTPAGSNRQYIRETAADATTHIRVIGTSRAENEAFIYLARHFAERGLPVPQVLSVSDDGMTYTQQDLGDTLLFDYLQPARESGVYSQQDRQLLDKTLRALAHIQAEGAVGLDWSRCYPVPAFDRRSIFWDLNYWKYCFLKQTDIDFSEPALEDDFEQLADDLLRQPADTFLYRDFQSRNVMVISTEHGLEPRFIDFQGGRRGPVYYDLASFLWQAKARYPQELREALLGAYCDEMRKLQPDLLPDDGTFRETLARFVLFRTLQVLGAYGFRGWTEGKPHFIQSIPFAVDNLRALFADNPVLRTSYPTLAELSHRLPADKPAKSNKSAAPESTTTPCQAADNTPEALTVTVLSFSYKRGIPQDTSGNGGGYVFDCRSTHNPGKYEQYKHLTGLDQPVIDFLENDGEITAFLDSVWRLTDHHTGRFLERGFTHLQIAFGCTGGQHRSVYCAEATARHLHEQFGVRVHLIHREQHIDKFLA